MIQKSAALVICLMSIGSLANAQALVDGSVDEGLAKSVTCAACHGPQGNSANPAWPSLAGQHATYIVKQLKAFKSGDRKDPLMSGQAMALSEEDMRNLAVYYASQTMSPKTIANADILDQGEALFRGGKAGTATAACMACHGPSGRGNPAAAFPLLRGQHATYVAGELRAYKAGKRQSDKPTGIMRDVAAGLSDKDIVAVASYVQGLK